MVPTEKEYFISTQTKFLSGAFISARLLGFCIRVAWRQPTSGWISMCQLGGKGQEADKAGSGHDYVLPLVALLPTKALAVIWPGCTAPAQAL